jgi:hypothetical protein
MCKLDLIRQVALGGRNLTYALRYLRANAGFFCAVYAQIL